MKSQFGLRLFRMGLVALCCCCRLMAQSPVTIAETASAMPAGADAAWAWVQESMPPDSGMAEGSVQLQIYVAHRDAQLRSRGLLFWKNFPEDKRRWQWLYLMVMTSPPYWRDEQQGARAWANKTPWLAAVDYAAKRKWEEEYVGMRAEYMASSDVSDEQRAYFRSNELWEQMRDIAFAIKRGEKTDLTRLANDVLDYGRTYPRASKDSLDRLANTAFRLITESDLQLQRAFIAGLRVSSHNEWQILANGYEQIVMLRDTPMDLQATALTGEPIDLAKLHGKVVLVDFWSLRCHGCIEAMPGIERVYQKYKNQGFEVVGVCLTFGRPMFTNEAETREVIRRQGATWKNTILVGAQDKEVREKYSIIGVPVTFLLDQNGKLVTNDVLGQKLEQEVRRLLGLHEEASGQEGKLDEPLALKEGGGKQAAERFK